MQTLTHAKVLALKPTDKPRKVSNGGGLYLEVFPSGHMTWRYTFTFNGRREKLTIGTCREAGAAKHEIVVSLDEAGSLVFGGSIVGISALRDRRKKSYPNAA